MIAITISSSLFSQKIHKHAFAKIDRKYVTTLWQDLYNTMTLLSNSKCFGSDGGTPA